MFVRAFATPFIPSAFMARFARIIGKRPVCPALHTTFEFFVLEVVIGGLLVGWFRLR